MAQTLHVHQDDTPMTARRMRKLHRRVRFAEWLAIVSMAPVAVFIGYLGTDPIALLAYLTRDVPGAVVATPAAAIALSSGICLVPIITFLLALWEARQVFHLLGTRPIFDLALPRRLLRLGSLASAAAISGIVARPLVVLVLTRGNPPGQQQLVIGISSEEIAGLIMGLLCYTFALIIQEAIGIELENRGFV